MCYCNKCIHPLKCGRKAGEVCCAGHLCAEGLSCDVDTFVCVGDGQEAVATDPVLFTEEEVAANHMVAL